MRPHESTCHTARGGLWCTCVARLYAAHDSLEVDDLLRRVCCRSDRLAELERRMMLPEADVWNWSPEVLAAWNTAATKVLYGLVRPADVDELARAIRAAGHPVRYGKTENEKGPSKTMQTKIT